MVIKIKVRKDIIGKIVYNLFFLIVIVACQDSNYSNDEYSFQNIEKEVTIKTSEIIDMTSLTPFNWNKLYIFKPYTPIKDINDSLGFVWKNADKTQINQDDSFNLLVFTQKDRIIKYIKWPRGKGDFSKIEPTIYFDKSARFLLKKEKFGDQDWLFFYSNN